MKIVRLLVVLLSLSALAAAGTAHAQRGSQPQPTPPSGRGAQAPAPPPRGAQPGSGPIFVSGFVRVISGDSIEAWVNGQRTAIGFIGIEAPSPNTDCGRAAVSALRPLVGGGVVLDEDATITFDHGRRMFYASTRDGRSIARELAAAGVVKATGTGKESRTLSAAQDQAEAANTGCLWGDPTGASLRPSSPSISAAALPPMPAAAVPSQFTEDNVISGLTEPTGFVFVPDGRIFVSLKHGLVRVYKNGALLPTPLIDLSDRVNDYWDHGLIGMALDPNFSTNGYIYLLYTYENNVGDYQGTKTGRLARYTVVGDTAAKATESVVLGKQVGSSCYNFAATADCIPSDGSSHSVGNIKFAADGTMFLTSGDASSFTEVVDDALRSQNLTSLAGKLLHITTDGKGVPGNPFYTGNPDDNQSKVWARGLRNPYRFNLNPNNGIPFVGDVGWNSVEEINVASAGANLGWPCYEGSGQNVGYASKSACVTLYNQGTGAVKAPLIEWSHNAFGGCCSAAATGGAIYTGTAYPAQYQGAYFYGDYGKDFLRYLKVDAGNTMVPGSDAGFATGAGAPVDIEMGPDQNIWYMAINAGQVRRVRYTGGGNQPPTAKAAANPNAGGTPLTVNFSSAASNDPDADTLTYDWDFGDGTAHSTAANPQHTYTGNTQYTATLTVSDGRGGTDSDTVQIFVGNSPPVPAISSPAQNFLFKVGDTITYAGSATDPEDGALAASRLTWDIKLLHCPAGGSDCHEHVWVDPSGTGAGVAGGSFTVPNHGDVLRFKIKLTATDSQGLAASTEFTLQPQLVTMTLKTNPDAGLNVGYNGASFPSPFVQGIVVGSSFSITAPSPQGGATFVSWSDGGAVTHTVTVNANVTYTATYAGITTVTFDDKTGQNQALNGQYPSGVIDWGSGNWYHSGPWGAFTTKSASFAGPNQTSGLFTFISPRRLLKFDANNSGNAGTTITASCAGQPSKQQVLIPGEVASIVTGWTANCGAVTLSSTNGWDTNFDNLMFDNVTGGGDTTAPTISNVASSSVTTTGATITWTTNEQADTQVEYGTTTSYGSSTTLNATLVTSHSQALSGLTPNTTYHYRVKSKDAAGNLATSGDFPFTTLADTTPPTITTAPQATSVTSTGATITWGTNEASDSLVEYGLDATYGQTASNASLVTNHSVPLSGLTASTTYHYRVTSKDAGNNPVTSGDLTFTTTAPAAGPVISNVAVSNITSNGARITWTTNVASDTQVEYGTTTALGTSTTLVATQVTSHTVNLTGLNPTTVYYFVVKSKVTGGTVSVSPVSSFATNRTVTFDDKTGQNQALNGQYPSGVIDWGSGFWYHSGPWGGFTTKSASFNGAAQTSGSFTLLQQLKLTSVQVYNGGGSSTTVTLTCAGQTTKTQAVGAGQVATITTGWTAPCTNNVITVQSTNGWDTNIDNLVFELP